MLRIRHTPKEVQPEFFPVVHQGKIKTVGERRTRVGDRIERLAVDVLGLVNIPGNGKYDVNFDAGIYFKNQEIFFEVKSVRKYGKSPLYVFRLEKELEAERQCGNPVIYIFCVHNISNVTCQKDITKAILKDPVCFYLLPLSEVVELTKDLPLKKIEKSKGLSGYTRNGYDQGYKNLNMKMVRESCSEPVEKGTVYARRRKVFKIFTSKNLNVELPECFGGK